jgi:hypothetical protein
MLAATAKIVDESRDLDVTFMFVPTTLAEGFGELGSEPYGILEKVAHSIGRHDFALPPKQAGLGLTWDKDAVERYRVC